jgi:hypothetical protein
VKRQDDFKENFNMLELSESLLWVEGHTTVTQDSTAQELPTVRHFIFPIRYCPKLAPSTKGGGRGLLLARSNLAYFVELHFSSNEIVSVAQFLAVFYIGISLCRLSGDHPQEVVERVMITFKNI